MSKKCKSAAPAAFLAGGATPCLPPSVNETLRQRLLGSSGGPLGGDSILRNRPLLSGFGALLIALAPVPAFAQTQNQNPQTIAQPDQAVAVRDRPHPEYDPLGLRFGSFKLDASLDLAVASTDNLFAATSSAAVDDIIYSEA